MKNFYFKNKNKSYILISHLDSFINNPNITEIYENYFCPEFSEKEIDDFMEKKDNKKKKSKSRIKEQAYIRKFRIKRIEFKKLY